MVATVRQFALAVVRIEEGRRRGAGGRAPARGNDADGWGPCVRERREGGCGWDGAGPRLAGLARLGWLGRPTPFFFNKTLFYFLFSKTKTKPNQNFSEKFDKILFEKLVQNRTLWYIACQQNKIK